MLIASTLCCCASVLSFWAGMWAANEGSKQDMPALGFMAVCMLLAFVAFAAWAASIQLHAFEIAARSS